MQRKNIKLIRCDITKSITNYINFYLNFLKMKIPGYKIFNKNIKIISGGYIGKRGILLLIII